MLLSPRLDAAMQRAFAECRGSRAHESIVYRYMNYARCFWTDDMLWGYASVLRTIVTLCMTAMHTNSTLLHSALVFTWCSWDKIVGRALGCLVEWCMDNDALPVDVLERLFRRMDPDSHGDVMMRISSTVGGIPCSNSIRKWSVLFRGANAPTPFMARLCRALPEIYVRRHWDPHGVLDEAVLDYMQRVGDVTTLPLFVDETHGLRLREDVRNFANKYFTLYATMCNDSTHRWQLLHLYYFVPMASRELWENCVERWADTMQRNHPDTPSCPLVMRPPLHPARVGDHVFELHAIVTWIAMQGTHPLTRARVGLHVVIVDLALMAVEL